MTDPQMIELLSVIDERLEALAKRQVPDYRGPYSELSQVVEKIATSMKHMATELTPLKRISTYSISEAVVRDVEVQIDELEKVLLSSQTSSGQLISKLNAFTAVPLKASVMLLSAGALASTLCLAIMLVLYHLSDWNAQKCDRLGGTLFDNKQGPVCGFFLEAPHD